MAYSVGHGFPMSSLAFVVVCVLLLYITPALGSPSFALQGRAGEVRNSSAVTTSTAAPAVGPSATNTSSNFTSITSTNDTSTSTTTSVVSTTTSSTTVTTQTILTANETTSTSSSTITSTSSSVTTSSSRSLTSKSTSEHTTIPSTSSSSSSSTLVLQFSKITPSSTSNFASETDVPSTTSPVQNVAAATTDDGFWSNKSAVAATFTVVSLIILGILAGLFTCLMKRKNRYKEDYREYERYPEPDARASSHNPPSPGLSTSELDHNPMDPFADPPNYYNFGIYDQAAAHSTDHSSSVSHDDPFSTATPQIVPSSSLTSVTTLTPGHPYANARGKLAPVTFKDPVARNSYQPSIDSFYGAANNPEHAAHAL